MVLASSCKTFSKARLSEFVGQKTGTVVGSVVGDAAGNEVAGTMIGGSLGAATGDALTKSPLEKQGEEIAAGIPEASVRKSSGSLTVDFKPGTLFQKTSSVTLAVTASEVLDKMAVILNKYASSRISITALNASKREASLLTGQKRAAALKNYLLSKGVDSARITLENSEVKSKAGTIFIILS